MFNNYNIYVCLIRWSPLVDPTEEEKELCNGLMSISFTNTSMIAGLYKFGNTIDNV